MKTVTAIYDSVDEARQAIHDLVDMGVARGDISLVSSNSGRAYDPYFDEQGRYIEQDPTSRDAAVSAGIGATIGGLGGVLMGLGLLAIPGVGPALAAGPIISGLVGAGLGGASGGLVGWLVNAGIPKEHAGYYSEAVRRGGHLVMANVEDAAVEGANFVLRRHNPVDLEARVSTWQATGWRGFDPKAGPYDVPQGVVGPIDKPISR